MNNKRSESTRTTKLTSLTIEGIPVEITQKKMKNMRIRVDQTNAIVKVSVPKRVSVKAATQFVMENWEWILSTRDKVLSRDTDAVRDFSTGDMILLWGQERTIEVVPSWKEKGVFENEDGQLIIMAPLDSTADYRRELVDKWYRERLWRGIQELKEECCQIAGKSPKEWRIKDMKTKWGTCNYRDRRIWLSLQLAKKPKECLKYVMLHELAHLYVPNHGPEFKEYMDRFMPQWREVKKRLNLGE